MKINYNGINFDSELEVEYFKHLENDKDVIGFLYHPNVPFKMTRGNTYTPDFLVRYDDRYEIIETKGYNPYSKLRDDMIHQFMLGKTEAELVEFCMDNHFYSGDNLPVVYKKIKHLKTYGFVEWDFKNPNTIANKRKEKINDLEAELKELRAFKKDTLRWFRICINKKCTKQQNEWKTQFFHRIEKELSNK